MEKKYPIGGYAPGNYDCKCCICGEQFAGDKRAVQCEPCAVKDKAVFDALSPTEQEELIKRNSAIAHIMFSYTGSGDQIIANQIAGMPLEEAIFQAGYSAGYDNGYERGRREADDWISVNDQLPTTHGPAIQVLIQNHTNTPIVNHWREIQRIKNEVFGPEVMAIEYFPAANELIDTHNIYWIFIFPDGMIPKLL